MKAKLGLILLTLLLVPAMAFAGATCAAPTIVPSDGRVVDFDFVANGTSNFYQFNATANHSYSVEVRQDYDGINTDLSAAGGGGVSVFSDAGTCGTAAAGLTDTTAAEPALPANSFRSSFTPTTTGSYAIKVTNGGATGRYISVSVAETTMYASAFSTISGFAAFYSFVNTTSQAITGSITAFSPAGVAFGAPVPINLAVGGNVSTNTGALGVPAGKTGYAVFTHNGPPAGVNAVCIVANFTTNFVEPINFIPIRERH